MFAESLRYDTMSFSLSRSVVAKPNFTNHPRFNHQTGQRQSSSVFAFNQSLIYSNLWIHWGWSSLQMPLPLVFAILSQLIVLRQRNFYRGWRTSRRQNSCQTRVGFVWCSLTAAKSFSDLPRCAGAVCSIDEYWCPLKRWHPWKCRSPQAGSGKSRLLKRLQACRN